MHKVLNTVTLRRSEFPKLLGLQFLGEHFALPERRLPNSMMRQLQPARVEAATFPLSVTTVLKKLVARIARCKLYVWNPLEIQTTLVDVGDL